jgi:tRNA G10  N-methylase Trm11
MKSSTKKKFIEPKVHCLPPPIVGVAETGTLISGLRLEVADDKNLRRTYFTPQSFAHPAKLNLWLVQWLVERYTRPNDILFDPMAGSGSLMYAALLQRNVVLRDVESWCIQLMQDNALNIFQSAGLFAGNISVGFGDARQNWGCTGQQQQPDVIITSPPYGCSVSPTVGTRSSYLDRKASKLAEVESYSERWTRLLKNATPGATGFQMFHYGSSPGQVGHYRGKRYWQVMGEIYQQAFVSLKPGGLMVLILKDHIKYGQLVATCDQTVQLCETLGFTPLERHQRIIGNPSMWQRQRREKGLPFVGHEDILVFRKPR